MQRTVRLELHPTPDQAKVLAETTRQFTEAFNRVCSYGWEQQEKNGVKLHHATYRTLKTELPHLVSDLHVQARVKATEAVKSALTLRKKGQKVSCPQSRSCAPRLNVHTFRLFWEPRSVRLSTTSGRISVPLSLPEYASRYQDYEVDTADLVFHKGRWWLHVVVTVPAPEIEPTREAVGVDLGITRPAVTSDNRFWGERRWRELEARDFRLRRALQKKGTKSAKRHLKKLSGRTARRRRDHDHVVSRRIVNATPPGATLVVENLTDIRKRAQARKANGNKRRLHSWSFANLRAFLAYKAEEKGIVVVGVDPRHTSKTCSRCGHQHRLNRSSQSWFRCRACGYELNADLNGSRNIRDKHLAGEAIRASGGHPSECLSSQPEPPSNETRCGLGTIPQTKAWGI